MTVDFSQLGRTLPAGIRYKFGEAFLLFSLFSCIEKSQSSAWLLAIPLLPTSVAQSWGSWLFCTFISANESRGRPLRACLSICLGWSSAGFARQYGNFLQAGNGAGLPVPCSVPMPVCTGMT